ncbi:protein ATAF2-like [Macadamia integrifolia]|uniref:protein ATAF2-like n=1 Tax=Macadamia integrifolia TaxID=60698 RepID=UPI001C531EA1|nr:protein ATAF2-like [Macadamia integrifolia]
MNSQSQSDNAVGMQGVVVHDDYDDNAAYFNSLPPGFRFCPNDEELINYYLQKKIKNLPLPLNRIRDVELYKHNPDYLAGTLLYEENQWYFFTPRDRKYKNGARPNRAAGIGYWKATGADKKIESNDQVVGFRKALVFYVGKAPNGDKSDWIMHEFRVIESESTPSRNFRGSDNMKLDDWVLCKMYKKPEKSEVNNTESQTAELTESQTEDIDNGNGVYSDVIDEDARPANTDPNISNSDGTGLINPSGGDETLQFNFPPLLSEPNYMFTDNYPYQSNINFDYGDPNSLAVPPISFKPPTNFIGDPNSSVVQPLSFMPPTNFMEGNYQQSSYSTGYGYDDYWDFKAEDFDMLPQYGEDFRLQDDFNFNMLPQDFSNNFPPVDESLPNNTATSPSDKSEEQPKSPHSSCK